MFALRLQPLHNEASALLCAGVCTSGSQVLRKWSGERYATTTVVSSGSRERVAGPISAV